MALGVLVSEEPNVGPFAAKIHAPNNARSKPLYLAINGTSDGCPDTYH
jgi:hypothetical protein